MKAVNLLPSDRGAASAPSPAKAPSPSGPASGAYFLIGALALVVVMAVAYVLVDNSVKDRRAELAQVKTEAQQVRAQANALKPYADFRQLASQRVQTVRDIARSRFDWERALRDVSRAMPADVHLKTFKGSVSNSIGGSAIRGGVVAPAIELVGCTMTQGRVARLMSRLRGVRGVTRVSLSKSEKPDQAAVATNGTDGQQPLCGPGSKPAFEIVMFFERAATGPAPATVPGQPAAPGSTPPAGQPAAGAPAAQGAQPASTPAPSTSGSTSQGVSNP